MRPLTDRERAVLRAMITEGAESSGREISAAERALWAVRIPEARVHGRCPCGTCPSIQLAEALEGAIHVPAGTIVLEAWTSDAILLLFIDDGRPSSLELAPTDGEPILEFPPAEQITF